MPFLTTGKRIKHFIPTFFDLDIKTDLVYIDTPYISAKGIGVNYFDFYHFLEGIVFMKNGKIDW